MRLLILQYRPLAVLGWWGVALTLELQLGLVQEHRFAL